MILSTSKIEFICSVECRRKSWILSCMRKKADGGLRYSVIFSGSVILFLSLNLLPSFWIKIDHNFARKAVNAFYSYEQVSTICWSKVGYHILIYWMAGCFSNFWNVISKYDKYSSNCFNNCCHNNDYSYMDATNCICVK